MKISQTATLLLLDHLPVKVDPLLSSFLAMVLQFGYFVTHIISW